MICGRLRSVILAHLIPGAHFIEARKARAAPTFRHAYQSTGLPHENMYGANIKMRLRHSEGEKKGDKCLRGKPEFRMQSLLLWEIGL